MRLFVLLPEKHERRKMQRRLEKGRDEKQDSKVSHGLLLSYLQNQLQKENSPTIQQQYTLMPLLTECAPQLQKGSEQKGGGPPAKSKSHWLLDFIVQLVLGS